MSSNGLTVPLNAMTEAAAKRWIRGNDSERENGVAVLAHFKSDENIAALKGLLTDPEVQCSKEGDVVVRRYPVRAAAVAALRAWGVEAEAVVRDTQAAGKR